MIGNNSAGAHSLTYGKTLDHVSGAHRLAVRWQRSACSKDLSPESLEDKRQSGHFGRSGLLGRLRDLRKSIRMKSWSRYPKIMRRVSGYNLDGVHQAAAL